MTYTLVLGQKNYSSWSMRAWLLLKLVGAPFEEVQAMLYRPGSREAMQGLGGATGLAPVLVDGELAIWDTLALFEYVAEQWPGVWPNAQADRARARSWCAELHSGFDALLEAMPLDARGRCRQPVLTEEVQADIERVRQIWSTANRASSPWLFDQFCAVDVMFAPIASRFRTYGIKLDGAAGLYQGALLAHSLVQEWFAQGAVDTDVVFAPPERIRA